MCYICFTKPDMPENNNNKKQHNHQVGFLSKKKKSSNFCMKTPNVSIVFKKEITENNGMCPPNQTYVITRGQKPLPLNITANNCTAVLA